MLKRGFFFPFHIAKKVKMEKMNLLSSLKLLWNPSLRSKCQQWQEMNSLGVLFPCDEERRGIVSRTSESVHYKVWASFFGRHALYIFSLFFLFYSVCLFAYFWWREHSTHDQQNKSAAPLVSGMEFLFKPYITQNENLSGLYRAPTHSVIIWGIPKSFVP